MARIFHATTAIHGAENDSRSKKQLWREFPSGSILSPFLSKLPSGVGSLYRREGIAAREGVTLARSTLAE